MNFSLKNKKYCFFLYWDISLLDLLVENVLKNIQYEFIQAFLCNVKSELMLSMLKMLEEANKNTRVKLNAR